MMDILSIRKKKRPASTSATAPKTTSTTATTTTSDAPLDEDDLLVAPAAPPESSSPAKTKAAATVARPPPPPPQGEAPLPPRHTALRPRVSVDPLEGFLARFDDDSDATEQVATPARDLLDATERYLAFELCGEGYAASIMDVREILTIRSLTEVPRAPHEVLGVVSKRGLVLPVIDLATTLGLRKPQRRLNTAQRVLVVGEGDRVCGLRVDAVAEVIKLSATQIESVPPSLGIRNAGLLLGLGRIGGSMYILLDLAAVLDAFAVSVGLTSAPRTEGGK